jgi:hypothetical protein
MHLTLIGLLGRNQGFLAAKLAIVTLEYFVGFLCRHHAICPLPHDTAAIVPVSEAESYLNVLLTTSAGAQF